MNIKEFIDDDFRGCCMAMCSDEVLYSSSTGFSDLANEIPNTITTKFATASAGKVFVAIAILQRNISICISTSSTLLNFVRSGCNDFNAFFTVG